MSTHNLFKKNFGDTDFVDMKHPNIESFFYELSAECLLEDVLIRAVKRKATYQVQFKDYDRNTWTAPYILSQDRVKELLDDASIKKIRLEFEI